MTETHTDTETEGEVAGLLERRARLVSRRRQLVSLPGSGKRLREIARELEGIDSKLKELL